MLCGEITMLTCPKCEKEQEQSLRADVALHAGLSLGQRRERGRKRCERCRERR